MHGSKVMDYTVHICYCHVAQKISNNSSKGSNDLYYIRTV